MKIKDEIAACGMTAVLWDEIVGMYDESSTRINKSNKITACTALFGTMKHSCPCCEFAKSNSPEVLNKKQPTGVNCRKCPMRDFWSTDERGSGYNCENEDSPYVNWEFEDDEKMSKHYASLVMHRAMNAMEYWKAMKSMNITW